MPGQDPAERREKIELFLHTEGREDPDLVEVDATGIVRSLLVETEPDGMVWIEEVNEEIELDLAFEDVGIHHRRHVHRGRCRRVTVIVQFNATDFPNEYGPSITIKTVYQWASGDKAADLSPEQKAKHVLALPGADHYLADGVHIGSLITPGTCEVTLNLLPRDSFAG
jgi:hypothetical protein